jgi:hypothetical protein
MEAICSSETSVVTEQTTRRHIPEDDTLQFQVLFSVETGNRKIMNDVLERLKRLAVGWYPAFA